MGQIDARTKLGAGSTADYRVQHGNAWSCSNREECFCSRVGKWKDQGELGVLHPF